MSTAEYKNAPLLISGSWAGLLMHDVLKMPGRFRIGFLENMPADEAVDMVYKCQLRVEKRVQVSGCRVQAPVVFTGSIFFDP